MPTVRWLGILCTLGFVAVGLLLTRSAPAWSAETPDQMVADFVSAYQQRNLGLFDATLHGDFTFFFSPEDASEPGIPDSHGRAAEMAITSRMFSGQPGQDRNGEPIPPITGFNLSLVPVDEWTPAMGEFEGTEVRTYQTELRVFFAGDFALEVRGLQQFYALALETPADDGAVTIYQLKAWRDLGILLKAEPTASETTTWGQLKMGYFVLTVPVSGVSLGEVKARYRDTP